MKFEEVLNIEPSAIFGNNLAKRANNIFLKDTETTEEFTYAEFLGMAQNLAHALRKNGLNDNCKVIISLNNSVDFAILYFACILGKIVTIPLNPILGDAQKKFIIEEANPDAIICTPEQVDKMQIWKGSNAGILLMNDKTHKLTRNTAVLEMRDKSPTDINNSGINGEQILTIVYTSGTTANPKGVVHTVGNLFRNATAFNDFMEIKSTHRFYNHLPMTYLGGYYNLLILPFCAGASTVIAKPFGPEAILNFWDPIINSGATVLWLVPTILHILNAYDRGIKGADYCKEKVELILCGTAPLHEEVRYKFTNKYGLPIYENYGLSETLFISAQNRHQEEGNLNVGEIVEFCDVKITDENNLNLENGEQGNIWVKTPTLMKGYFASWKEGSELRNTDWFDTGDYGKVEKNILSITGRVKDIIIRGGINISPMQIEDIILKAKGVKECAVVGISDLLSGEIVIAYVTLIPGTNEETILAEIYDNCKQFLSPIHQPDRVLIIEEMPKSSTGKIRKNDLRNKLGK